MPVLGKIGLVNRGTYSASATYTALDFVLYNGSSYVALKSVKGATPTNDGINWQTLAEGTAASLYLENSLTYATAGQRALDAAQGPAIKALIDAKANSTDVPPKNHASTATTYGLGTASNYGHVKTTDTYSSKQASAAAANGIVPSQNALYNAYANRAPISHASTGTTYGIGNASNFGHVKVSDTYATKQSSAAAANGVAASQNALYNVYSKVDAIGKHSDVNGEDVNTANNTLTNIATVTMSAGETKMIQLCAQWESNATGYREIVLAESATSGAATRFHSLRGAAASGSTTNQTLVCFIDGPSSGTKTYYFNARQNSGGTLKVAYWGVRTVTL